LDSRKLLIWGAVVVLAIAYFILKPDFRNGKAVFKSEGCVNCHRFKNIGYGAIDLSNVARTRTDGWIRDHIKNPKLHDPLAGMPSFDYLPEEEIQALIDFLHSDP
jgi:cbb3-type cytochrome oxidase cytochrome c subunit